MANTKKLILLDNIQFIYELALARLELHSFNPGLKVTNDFREFELEDDGNLETPERGLAYFETVNGEYCDYYYLQRYNQTKSVNQYLTHWIYPYKGKFHPQMIGALMNVIKVQNGETLFDPFVARGTAVVLIKDIDDRITYLECKTYNQESIGSSFRAFYFQPSESSKITHDARHLMVGFEIVREKRNGKSVFVPIHWKLYTLEGMLVQVKHEFNASNKGMYRPEALLAEGSIR